MRLYLVCCYCVLAGCHRAPPDSQRYEAVRGVCPGLQVAVDGCWHDGGTATVVLECHR